MGEPKATEKEKGQPFFLGLAKKGGRHKLSPVSSRPRGRRKEVGRPRQRERRFLLFYPPEEKGMKGKG